MRVHTSADTIAVKIEDVTITFKPLTYAQKKHVCGCVSQKGASVIEDRMEMVRLAIKYSVKDVDGLTVGADAKPYTVTLGADKCLDEETIDNLMNIEGIVEALTNGSLRLATGGPFTELVGEDGNALEGVTVIAGK